MDTVCNMQIDRKCVVGRPKMTWKTLSERDHREWNLNEVDPCDRDVGSISSVRSAMRAASKLPGKEPTDVDDAPTSAVNLNADECILYSYQIFL